MPWTPPRPARPGGGGRGGGGRPRGRRRVGGATAGGGAEKTQRPPAEVVKTLIGLGEMATATQSLSDEALTLLCGELGYEAEIVGIEEDEEEPEEEGDEGRLEPRGAGRRHPGRRGPRAQVGAGG